MRTRSPRSTARSSRWKSPTSARATSSTTRRRSSPSWPLVSSSCSPSSRWARRYSRGPREDRARAPGARATVDRGGPHRRAVRGRARPAAPRARRVRRPGRAACVGEPCATGRESDPRWRRLPSRRGRARRAADRRGPAPGGNLDPRYDHRARCLAEHGGARRGHRSAPRRPACDRAPRPAAEWRSGGPHALRWVEHPPLPAHRVDETDGPGSRYLRPRLPHPARVITPCSAAGCGCAVPHNGRREAPYEGDRGGLRRRGSRTRSAAPGFLPREWDPRVHVGHRHDRGRACPGLRHQGPARADARRRVIGATTALLLLVGACGPQDPIADQLDTTNQVFAHDPAGAVARYRDLQVKRPTAPEISIDLGNALAALGEHDRALVEYGRGIDTAKGTTRAIAFYDRATSLFRLGRILDARAAYVEALRNDPNDRDAKFNIEIIDRILGQIPSQKNPTSSPVASTEPPGQQQPGGSPQATAPAAGSGKPTGTPVPDVTGSTGATQPESVQSALTNSRKDLTLEDALRLLDALRGEQRGLPAILEGTGVRRGGNVDVPY